MVKQAANVGVMQGFRRGSTAIRGGDLRISHKGLEQRLEVSVLKRGDEIPQSLPEFVNVFGGLGKVVGEFNLRFTQLAQLVNGQLKAIFIPVDQSFNLEEVVLLEGAEYVLHVVPHLGVELPATVAEN